LRTTGRAFGIGTLCFAGEEAAACFAGGEAGSFAAEEAAGAEYPKASVSAPDRTADNAVDRNAFVRTNGATAFLRCESIAECD
jgi:hypothetical protein